MRAAFMTDIDVVEVRDDAREPELDPAGALLRVEACGICGTDARTFFYQLRKRIPPNPVQATVDCEGAFDERSRVGYQIRDLFTRLRPSISRVLPVLFSRQR